MKKKRHALILQLVQNHAVATQDELLQLLREKGADDEIFRAAECLAASIR